MNKKFSTIVSTMVIGGMLLSSSTAVLADTTTDSSAASNSAVHGKAIGDVMGRKVQGKRGDFMGKGINKELAALVKENVITQETADKVNAYIESKDNERKTEMEKIKAMTAEERKAYQDSKKSTVEAAVKKTDVLSEMVTAGIITQAQADAIKAYQQEERAARLAEQQAKRGAEEKRQYDELVAAGVITQETVNAITEYRNDQEETRKAEMEKVKAMTEAERKAYLESKKTAKSGEKKDAYSGLVAAGIITQEQADAIKAYQQEEREAKQAEQQAKRQEDMKTKLDSLVSEGTITEDQKAKVVELLNAQEESRKAEMEKIKAMTDSERKAYMESKKTADKGARVSPLKDLVDAGVLTQTQADAVMEKTRGNFSRNDNSVNTDAKQP